MHNSASQNTNIFALLADERVDTSTLNSDVELFRGDSLDACRQAFDPLKDDKILVWSLDFGHYKTARFRNAVVVTGRGSGVEMVVSRFNNGVWSH